jgi:uncharacterized protein (TIGR03435 family)
VGREVIDKTGIIGTFEFHMALPPLPPPGATAGEDDAAAVMAALQKLGLKLESTKTTAPYLVIDHIERPTEN